MADRKEDSAAPTQPPAQRVEDIPDPDEDDLDDLDDVLDEFSAAKLDDGSKPAQTPAPHATTAQSPPPAASAAATANHPPPPPTDGPGDDPEIDEAEFARQLQAGMAELLSGLGEESSDMTQQLESLMQELTGGGGGGGGGGAGAAGASGGASAAAPAKPAKRASKPVSGKTSGYVTPTGYANPGSGTGGPKRNHHGSKSAAGNRTAGEDSDFQDQIRRTMERMAASGEQASAAAAASSSSSAGNPDDMLAQMLAEMEKGGFGGGGGGGGEGGSDEDFSKMLMGMMEQLTNKEILYEPMKELHDKFPKWLADNSEKTEKADLERYEEQKRCVDDIVERFERPGYSDDSSADREFIVERMQKMQAAGSPPQDLVGDMSSAQEALGELDQGCATQ